MNRLFALLAVVGATLALGACAHHGGGQGGMHRGHCPQGSSSIYWCGNAADGGCSAISTTPGTCPDGKPMSAGHVVWTEGNTALVCACGAGCTCEIDAKDHAKCGCGKPTRRIDLTGTGIYFCNCGGSCGCNTLSDKPGTCKCGMQLHQAK